MGSALLAGWLDRGLDAATVSIVEPAGVPVGVPLTAAAGIYAGPDELPDRLAPRVVVFAVKPQAMDTVVPAYRRFAWPETVFLSIAAGRTLASFARLLGGGAAVVRAMPNTPAAIRRGITAACGNRHVDLAQRDLCTELLAAVGEVVWVDDEALIDAVTAVSGSGPAYVFHLVEAMTAAGIAAGLPPDLAERLARATVTGAAALLDQSSDTPATLRRNVTSPGGTTEAALAVLLADDGLTRLMTDAVAAAAQRARELAG
jgi:pyrroline-5-carboxylate reductase